VSPIQLTPQKRNRLLEAVQREHEQSHALLGTATNAVVASRSLGLTLTAAILGFGVNQGSWPLVAVGAGLACVAYLIDGYYSWRAEEIENYVKRLERIRRAEYRSVRSGPGTGASLRLDARLRGLRVGPISQIRTFGWKDVWYGRPTWIFRILYPGLIITLIATALTVGLTAGNDNEKSSDSDSGQTSLSTEVSEV
jgi:hypothetical protein